MNCPRCGTPMNRGVAEIRGMLRTFLLVFGFSYQPLWWKADGEKPELMMQPRAPREAFKCEKCATLVLAPPPPERVAKQVPNPLAQTVFRPVSRNRRKR